MIPIRDTAPCNSTPYVTWSLMAICIFIFPRHAVHAIRSRVPTLFISTGWCLIAIQQPGMGALNLQYALRRLFVVSDQFVFTRQLDAHHI